MADKLKIRVQRNDMAAFDKAIDSLGVIVPHEVDQDKQDKRYVYYELENISPQMAYNLGLNFGRIKFFEAAASQK